MAAAQTRTLRRLITGLTPIVLVAAALPLMAPTCGGLAPGVKTFSKGSLIIPMDVCYQCSLDTDTGTTGTSPSACSQPGYQTPTGPGFSAVRKSCPQATDPGDVIKAYGLVYQLIRAGIPVYWIINPAKANLDDIDLTVSFSGGPPVQRYDWNGGTAAAPTSGVSIQYLGGPFVVDGSDFARAVTVLQANKAAFSSVKVHVTNVAFQGSVARTMAGGWTANANTPPKLALLDIGSTGSGAGTKNSEVVIRGYLIKAGLDVVGAGGTSAAGQHGTIYDRLTMADFIPTTPNDWTTTKLYQNGYQILWVPHWLAPGSCSDCTTSASTGSGTCPTTTCPCTNRYSAADIAAALKTIGAFYNAGHDVFAECAGLGSFEGVLGSANATPSLTPTVNASYGPGDATTHFHTTAAGTGPAPSATTTGIWFNKGVSSSATFQGGYASPFMQIGDFVFKPYSGAIQNYRPTTYNSSVTRFLSEPNDTTYDIFTIVPAQAGGHGTSVYLGGHSYSGCDGTFQTAGSRLVLNSLFNLGASCIASGVTCSTGYLGICSTGTMTCNAATGEPECTATVLPNAQSEICNGLDDNCNGLVDEGISGACYDGTAATRGIGLCHDGVRSCERLGDGTYALGECVGDQLPSVETCNGLDDDCDGATDEGLEQACYDGPSNTIGTSGDPNPMCKRGVRTCTNGSFGACRICTAAEAAQPIPPADCQILPLAVEYCGGDLTGNGVDDNCNGAVDENCGCSSLPIEQQTRACYTGTPGTAGNLPCTTGTQSCVSNAWGPCTGQVLPSPAEVCDNSIDDDCNGTVDDPTICNLCPTVPTACYTGPPGTLLPAPSVCAEGELVCAGGVTGTCGGVVGETTFKSPILPSPELCDGLDNDCDGTTDEGASCGTGFNCINGLCVGATCGPEFPCPEGFTCDGAPGSTGTCVLANCGTLGTPCPSGDRCLAGACVDPCASVICGNPSICAGGFCTGVACSSTGCGSGLVCKIAGCTTDLCANVACPSGTFCREGDCVQACTFVTCAAGQRCGTDGFCVADPCSGVTCPQDRPLCDADTGACSADPCLGLSCGAGQMCSGGFCIDDPCAFIECPAGICYRGQCFPSGNPTGVGIPPAAPPEPEDEAGGGGCGCGAGAGSSGLLLFALLGLPLARRRRQRPTGGLLAIGLAIGLTGLLAGCPKEEEEPPPVAFDPSACAETCGEQRCVSLASDAAHCGQCTTPCNAGDICVDGMCGPGSAVAPFIRGLTPDSAGKGTATVPVTITGDRFQSGATLRIIRPPPALPETVPTSFGSAQQLQATLDLSTDPVQTVYLRVVNPDRVISPVVAFQVVPVSPVVTAWTPSPLVVLVGPAPATLHATGTGLTTGSQCHLFSRVTSVETVLPTLNQTGTALDCTLDTTGLSLGEYDLWVVNDGLLASAKSTLSVTSDQLTITSLSPSSGAEGSTQPVSVTVYGSGFNNDAINPSQVFLSTTSGGSTFTAQVTTFVDPTQLRAQLDLKPGGVSLPAGANYKVKVSNGPGEDSNLVDFAIVSNPPTVTSVSFSPQPIYQNATETITFDGLNLTGGSIQIRKPDATIVSPATAGTATQRTATVTFTPASWPAGTYQAYLLFPDASSSTSYPFTILSNVAILSAVSPAGGDQGTSPTLSLTGANFFTGMRVFVLGLGAAGAEVEVTPVTVATANSATTGALSLVNRNTGVYRVVARNTGAADSNSLGFSVTPAVPSISGVSICTTSAFTTCSPATATTQSATPIYLKISGSNFAKPDVNGNGGSQLVAWNTGTVPPIASSTTPINVGTLSGCTVTANDYASIHVTFDSRAVFATTSPYTLQVWNPGGATPPQKSGTTPFTVNP